MNRRKIVYGAIYVTVAIMFPGLPLAGLRFIGGLLTGTMEGIGMGSKEYAKNEIHSLWSSLNPFD